MQIRIWALAVGLLVSPLSLASSTSEIGDIAKIEGILIESRALRDDLGFYTLGDAIRAQFGGDVQDLFLSGLTDVFDEMHRMRSSFKDLLAKSGNASVAAAIVTIEWERVRQRTSNLFHTSRAFQKIYKGPNDDVRKALVRIESLAKKAMEVAKP